MKNMGRYENLINCEKSSIGKVRTFPWGKLVRESHQSIRLETDHYAVVFHTFGAPRGSSYRNWKRFGDSIFKKGERLTINDVYQYANRHDICHYLTSRKGL